MELLDTKSHMEQISSAVSPLESCLGFKADLYQDKIPTFFMLSLITAQSICSPLSTTCKATQPPVSSFRNSSANYKEISEGNSASEQFYLLTAS